MSHLINLIEIVNDNNEYEDNSTEERSVWVNPQHIQYIDYSPEGRIEYSVDGSYRTLKSVLRISLASGKELVYRNKNAEDAYEVLASSAYFQC